MGQSFFEPGNEIEEIKKVPHDRLYRTIVMITSVDTCQLKVLFFFHYEMLAHVSIALL